MLPMSNERIEQNADFSLKLRSVGLKDLGPYSCQVRSREDFEIRMLLKQSLFIALLSFSHRHLHQKIT